MFFPLIFFFSYIFSRIIFFHHVIFTYFLNPCSLILSLNSRYLINNFCIVDFSYILWIAIPRIPEELFFHDLYIYIFFSFQYLSSRFVFQLLQSFLFLYFFCFDFVLLDWFFFINFDYYFFILCGLRVNPRHSRRNFVLFLINICNL